MKKILFTIGGGIENVWTSLNLQVKKRTSVWYLGLLNNVRSGTSE